MDTLKKTSRILPFLILPFIVIAQPRDTLNVLFVGNSFTFFWNLPQLVGAMAESQGIPMRIRQSTVSGATWEQHWKGEKGLQTRSLVREGKWDVVVLQNHSTAAIDDPAAFGEYGKMLTDLVRTSGGQPLLFATWAYASNPLQQPAITTGYAQLAKSLSADIAPVGQIWESARKYRPDLNLFFDDKHPSPSGSYLCALALFKKLTGKSVLPMASRLSTIGKDGEKLYLAFVDEEDAAFFKQLVEEFPMAPPMLKSRE